MVCSAPRNKEEAKPGDIRGAEHTVGVIPPASASAPIIDPVDEQIDRDDSVAIDTVAPPEGEGVMQTRRRPTQRERGQGHHSSLFQALDGLQQCHTRLP
jgi:hypothetical protein